MRILVTGACGLLGSHLMAHLSAAHEAVGVDRNPWWAGAPVRVEQADLHDSDRIRKIVGELRPQLLIHCAALADVDACEKDPARAFASNAELTRQLILSVGKGAKVVYISTDGIFEGTRPFSAETTAPHPKTVYGRSKLEGERVAREQAPDHLIVRTNFYGWSSGRKKTFAEWLYDGLEKKRPITLFNDFFFTPIYVVDLVERMACAVEKGLQGIVHIAGGDRLSKYEFGKLLAEKSGFSLEGVRVGSLDDADFLVQRPKDMSLDSALFSLRTGLPPPDAGSGLERFLRDRTRPLRDRFKKEPCLT